MRSTVVLPALLLMACALDDPERQVVVSRQPFERRGDVYLGGPPDAAALRAFAEERGLRAVVDLRPSGEMGFDERAEARALGLHYVALPFEGPAPSVAEADAALAALAAAPRPVLVHCGDGARSALLFALYRATGGADPFAALDEARALGAGDRALHAFYWSYLQRRGHVPADAAPPR